MAYNTSWDCPHRPGPQELWQESDCYWWYDTNHGVGGFHRIGQKPNAGTGQLTVFAFDRDGERYASHDELPIGPEDRWETGHRVGGHHAEALGDGKLRFAWSEAQCEADLEFYESFHEPRNWSKTGHSDDFMSNINSDGHLECSGRLRGEVRIGERSYDVDALAHRDRSWGFRDSSRVSMHRYRMFSGTVGPELSFATFLLDLKDGPPMVAGFVARDGVDLDVRDLRVLTTFDADGLSAVGATAIMTLENGEQVTVACDGVQGFATPVPEAHSLSSDTICTFQSGGKTGFVDLELSNNPGRGTYIATADDLSLLASGGLSGSLRYPNVR